MKSTSKFWLLLSLAGLACCAGYQLPVPGPDNPTLLVLPATATSDASQGVGDKIYFTYHRDLELVSTSQMKAIVEELEQSPNFQQWRFQ